MAPGLPKFAKNALKFIRKRTRNSENGDEHTRDILPWGSDHHLEALEVTKMCISIPIKWRVDARDFDVANVYNSMNVGEYRKRQVFRVQGLPNVRFSLNLYYLDAHREYRVEAKSEAEWTATAVELGYAFVTCDHRTYHLATSSREMTSLISKARLTYEDFMKNCHRLNQWGYVTIHCMVKIEAEVCSRLIRAVVEDNRSTRIDIECEVGRRSSIVLDDSMEGGVLARPETEQFLRHHFFSGEFGNLSVDVAMELIEHRSHVDLPHVIALCVDFLKQHLTHENVLEVLRLAQSHRLDSLKDVCVYFLHENFRCKLISVKTRTT